MRQRSARGRSPRASAIGASAASTACRNQPSQTLSPRPSRPTRFMPSFQSPDPIKRQAMGADGQADLDRPRAMLEQGDLVNGALGLEVGIVLVGPQLGPVDERDHLVEDPGVAGDREVAIDGVRQPEPVVGDPGPDAAPGRRMPPVLDVAGRELLGGGAQEMLPDEARLEIVRAMTSWSWSRKP